MYVGMGLYGIERIREHKGTPQSWDVYLKKSG